MLVRMCTLEIYIHMHELLKESNAPAHHVAVRGTHIHMVRGETHLLFASKRALRCWNGTYVGSPKTKSALVDICQRHTRVWMDTELYCDFLFLSSFAQSQQFYVLT